MVSAELEGYARTGGLGDAVMGLSRALARHGHEVMVVTPRYGVTAPLQGGQWHLDPIEVALGEEPRRNVGVYEIETRVGSGRLSVALLDEASLFDRAGIYGDAQGSFGDNEVRFATMSRAALSVGQRRWGRDFVLHAHDWHASFAPIYARTTVGQPAVPSVITVHNLAHQGVFTFDVLDRLGIPRTAYHPDGLEHHGTVNLLKGGMAFSHRVTTVSPTYAREILTRSGGFGLDGFLRARTAKLDGFLNGIDDASYDPARDPALVAGYDGETVLAGKRRSRSALARELGLRDDDSPLVATVGRLAWQKGMDLFLDLVPAILARGARVVVVGNGDPVLEERLRALSGRFPGSAIGLVAFDEVLARRVFASASLFVVPSRFEPCGLVQMYAMRYGAVPVVTPVGGLRDSVKPLRFGSGTGVVAEGISHEALFVAIAEALDRTSDEDERATVSRRCMAEDFSWTKAALPYLSLYDSLLSERT